MSFPIGSSVILRDLVGASHLNGKYGVVKSCPNAGMGTSDYRQEVYVIDAKKKFMFKPSNLRYEPRDIDSLTTAEMKCILQMIYNDSLKIVEYISHCIERITFERQYIISMKSRNIDSLIHI